MPNFLAFFLPVTQRFISANKVFLIYNLNKGYFVSYLVYIVTNY